MAVCGAGESGAVNISAEKFFALTAMLAGFVPVDTNAGELGATATRSDDTDPSGAEAGAGAGTGTGTGTDGVQAPPRPAG